MVFKGEINEFFDSGGSQGKLQTRYGENLQALA